MRQIGTEKYVSHIMTSHIKRAMILNSRIGSIKKDDSKSHKRKFADKKHITRSACLYCLINNWIDTNTRGALNKFKFRTNISLFQF
jgi:hypothetical protein